MSDTNRPQNKSLSQIVDEIEDEKVRAITGILILRYAKREGFELGIQQPYAYNFKPGFADLIINTLADMCLNFKLPPKKQIPDAFNPIFESVKPEIEKIYSAIKKVGFSARQHRTAKDYMNAALRCFDNSNNEFEAIKREYLEDDELFFFGNEQQRRTFEAKILNKIFKDIMKDLGCGKFSSHLLRKIYKKG
jgi:hypothetical protein